MVVFDDFSAGPIMLRDLVNHTRLVQIEEFQVFLKVLEVYGSGYYEDTEEQPKEKNKKAP